MNLSTAHLEQKNEFMRILADYQPSPAARQELLESPLVLLVGVSSAGRDTLVRALGATRAYYEIVTTTTRPPRINDGVLEQDGVEYHFRSEAQVLQLLKEGQLIAPALIHEQQVSGVNVAEFTTAKNRQQIALTDLDPMGTLDILQAKPDATAIFVLPPSFEEWLYRLGKRGQLAKEELRRRLESALKEFDLVLDNRVSFVFVINDDLAQTVHEIDDLAHGKHHPQDEQQAHQLAEQLREETKQYLART